MYRCVRQENTKVAIERRDSAGDRAGRPPAQQHNGTLGPQQQLARPFVQFAERLDGLEVGQHDRKRLLDAPFSLAQARHGLRICRVAGKVKAAQPLDGDASASLEFRCRRREGIGCFDVLAGVRPEFHLRPAFPTGVGLRVETPVDGVIVLGLARAAHRKDVH